MNNRSRTRSHLTYLFAVVFNFLAANFSAYFSSSTNYTYLYPVYFLSGTILGHLFAPLLMKLPPNRLKTTQAILFGIFFAGWIVFGYGEKFLDWGEVRWYYYMIIGSLVGAAIIRSSIFQEHRESPPDTSGE